MSLNQMGDTWRWAGPMSSFQAGSGEPETPHFEEPSSGELRRGSL